MLNFHRSSDFTDHNHLDRIIFSASNCSSHLPFSSCDLYQAFLRLISRYLHCVDRIDDQLLSLPQAPPHVILFSLERYTKWPPYRLLPGPELWLVPMILLGLF